MAIRTRNPSEQELRAPVGSRIGRLLSTEELKRAAILTLTDFGRHIFPHTISSLVDAFSEGTL